jgi:hypothetical protein
VTRLLLAILGFAVIIYVLRGLNGALGGPAASRPARAGRPRTSGATDLVRDRVCNTFVPLDRALRVTRGGETLYFCSDACRARHLAELPGARLVS